MRVFICLFFLCSSAFAASTLKVKITDVRSEKGDLVVVLYDKEEVFLKDSAKALKQTKIPAKSPTAEITFTELKTGQYAIALHHDENSDGKMQYNFVGMPKEGFGFSKNKRVMFGPPSFKDAQVDLQDTDLEIELRAKYF